MKFIKTTSITETQLIALSSQNWGTQYKTLVELPQSMRDNLKLEVYRDSFSGNILHTKFNIFILVINCTHYVTREDYKLLKNAQN